MRHQLYNARAVHLAVLTAPFIVVVAALVGLTHDFPVYQSGDEHVHFDIVLQVARTWPRPVLWGYGAWSGPLVYWLLAGIGLPFGNSLVATRLVVAVLSWATCALAYLLFRDRLQARPLDALALALVLALSPFFFGQSFAVLTDNPTWLFVVAALYQLVAYAFKPRMGRLAAFTALAGVAALMRQFSAWLFVPAAVALAGSGGSRRRLASGAAILAAGVLPLALLALAWGGALPRGSGPGGVGHPHPLSGLLLSLAVVGIYGALMLPAAEIERLPAALGRVGALAVGTAAVLALLALAAGALRGAAGRDPYTLGWLSFVGRLYHGPQNTSLLLWLLVPLGAAVMTSLLWTRLRTPVDRVLVVALASLIGVTMAAPVWYQRYVDFPTLLLLSCLALTAGSAPRTADRLRWLVTIVLSAAWLMAYAKVG